jgi:hypothetical protein
MTFSLSSWPRRFQLVLLLALWLGAVGAVRALELHSERAAKTDLALTGLLGGVPAGEARYVRWSDLRALPTEKLTLSGEFVPGEQEVTVVFLSELWKVLPRAASADTLFARCNDGYTSIYSTSFIEKERPFLVLEINGAGPEKWPPPGLKFNPGPYVITVSDRAAPGVSGLLDVNHKKPWGVSSLEIGNFAERERDLLTGPGAKLSASGKEGREIWINSCASCHSGPGNAFGGSKSDRPFAVLAAHAQFNQDYFKKYVRNPKSLVPTAKMEPHPHYTDEQLEALISFIIGMAGKAE